MNDEWSVCWTFLVFVRLETLFQRPVYWIVCVLCFIAWMILCFLSVLFCSQFLTGLALIDIRSSTFCYLVFRAASKSYPSCIKVYLVCTFLLLYPSFSMLLYEVVSIYPIFWNSTCITINIKLEGLCWSSNCILNCCWLILNAKHTYFNLRLPLVDNWFHDWSLWVKNILWSLLILFLM